MHTARSFARSFASPKTKLCRKTLRCVKPERKPKRKPKPKPSCLAADFYTWCRRIRLSSLNGFSFKQEVFTYAHKDAKNTHTHAHAHSQRWTTLSWAKVSFVSLYSKSRLRTVEIIYAQLAWTKDLCRGNKHEQGEESGRVGEGQSERVKATQRKRGLACLRCLR